AVQGRRVPVVCHGDADRVSRRDRRDNLGIVSAVLAWWFRRPAGGCTAGRPDRRVCGTARKRLPGRSGGRPAEGGRKRPSGRSGGRPAEGGRTHLPAGTVGRLALPVGRLALPGDQRLLGRLALPVSWLALPGDQRLLVRRALPVRRLALPGDQRLLEQRDRLGGPPRVLIGRGQFLPGGLGIGVLGSQHLFPGGESLLEEGDRLV